MAIIIKSFGRLSSIIFVLLLWGPATAQNPCEGRGTCDALLINKGRPWDYKVSSLNSPRILTTQAPDSKEKQVIESLAAVFNASTIKGVALLHGDKLIHLAVKDNLPEDTMFYGLSIGKTVTAIAAGQKSLMCCLSFLIQILAKLLYKIY